MINISVVHGIAVPNYSNIMDYISMYIYSPLLITEDIENNYKPTRLYIKELNGLKYFGKTILKNVQAYTGSGTRWNHQIKKYGKENIKTLWVSEWFYCPHYLQEFALMFSEQNNIVNNSEWANLTAENGLSGGHFNLAAKSEIDRKEIYKKVANTLANKSPEQKRIRSNKHTKTLTAIWETRNSEDRIAHATNTALGVKKMWDNMTTEQRTIRKQNEMKTKNAKSYYEIEEIKRKQKEARQRLLNRPNVIELKELAGKQGIKLGINWRAKPNHWIAEKLGELKNI